MSDPILELLAAPPSPPMSIDEDAVYAGGRRRVRRRALRRAAVGVVGVVAASAIAFATIGDGLGREALPAGPTPSASMGKPVSATLFDGTYAVEVIPGAPADQANVIFYSVKDGKRTKLAGSSAEATVISMGTGSGAEGVMLGTAPADDVDFATITPGSTQGIYSDAQPLPGTDYQAVALRFEKPSEVDTYRDTIGINDRKEVHNGMGTRLPSVRLDAKNTFYLDQEHRVMGVFTDTGSVGKPLRNGTTQTMGFGKRPDAGPWTWTSLTVIPGRATDVSFEWVDAATTSLPISRTFNSGEYTLVYEQATAPGTKDGPRVNTVTWTDEAGTRHTDPVVD